LVSERVDPALVSVWSVHRHLLPSSAAVRRHPSLLITVCSCSLP